MQVPVKDAGAHQSNVCEGANLMIDESVEKLFAILAQTVASVLADTKLEVFALRQLLAEQQKLSQKELDSKIVALRGDKLPTLTASTSKEIQDRFWKLREMAGLG
jgi:hypothetical protein